MRKVWGVPKNRKVRHWLEEVKESLSNYRTSIHCRLKTVMFYPLILRDDAVRLDPPREGACPPTPPPPATAEGGPLRGDNFRSEQEKQA